MGHVIYLQFTVYRSTSFRNWVVSSIFISGKDEFTHHVLGMKTQLFAIATDWTDDRTNKNSNLRGR